MNTDQEKRGLFNDDDQKISKTRYFAHRKAGEAKENWQPLIHHLKNTARLAREFAAPAQIGEFAFIVGLVHDLGKYSEAFQRRLEGGKPVDHSTAGATELLNLLSGTQYAVFAKLLAYPITGHHSGLLDYGDEIDLEGKSLCARLKKENLPDFSAYKTELDLSNLQFPKNLHLRLPNRKIGFSLSFLTRMIYSALVDADFQETETYMSGKKSRGEFEEIPALCQKLNTYLRQYEHPSTDINRQRTQTLQACMNNAKEKPGFFKLTVPTGGGKTLASMAFALNHAMAHKLRRVIYVIPFTTIIEQNANVFKYILGEANVLEHHSNFDWEQTKQAHAVNPDDQTNNIYTKLKLAAENWDIPIIVTTNVQFFESLFANKSSRCRKLHNIAKSVIIFDEAQMLPREYLRPSMAAVWELVTNYGSSAVFCTATQPNLEQFMPEPIKPIELAPEPAKLFDFYKRVDVINLGELSDEELLIHLEKHNQALCIVNTRRYASGLFDGLQGEGNFHLSTLMCPAHRTVKLQEIRHRLKTKLPCRVVSTTVMEAGIDIDFPVGYRALTGLDSINQAAGRVNREMRHRSSALFVFDPKSEFIKRTPTYIKQAVEVARIVLRDYPEQLISIPAITAYFNLLYSLQDPTVSFDYKNIIECLNSDDGRFKFETVGRLFRFIEEQSVPVIITYDEVACRLIDELKYTKFPSSTMRKLQPFTVSIYQGEFEKLSQKGAISTIQDIFHFLDPGFFDEYYDPHRGLVIPDNNLGEGLFF